MHETKIVTTFSIIGGGGETWYMVWILDILVLRLVLCPRCDRLRWMRPHHALCSEISGESRGSVRERQVRGGERGFALSACCLRNLSLAPEPPGVLVGILIFYFGLIWSVDIRDLVFYGSEKVMYRCVEVKEYIER